MRLRIRYLIVFNLRNTRRGSLRDTSPLDRLASIGAVGPRRPCEARMMPSTPKRLKDALPGTKTDTSHVTIAALCHARKALSELDSLPKPCLVRTKGSSPCRSTARFSWSMCLNFDMAQWLIGNRSQTKRLFFVCVDNVPDCLALCRRGRGERS